MQKDVRTICYDEDLQIEAYHFKGTRQPFPNHFHEYYVIGLMEEGSRYLSCKNETYHTTSGNIMLLNPGDNHACKQSDGSTLNYRGLNISKKIMLNIAAEVTGKKELPGFSQNVIYDEEVNCYFHPLHQLIMSGSHEFEKEEHLLLMIALLIERYCLPFESCIPECRQEVEHVCDYLQKHYTEHICLEQICSYAHISKSTLLRSFTKHKGITPYRFLQNIRINEAKKLLEQGVSPVDAALQTGFSDQSHFTNFFNMFIGLTPGTYRDIFQKRTLALQEPKANESKNLL